MHPPPKDMSTKRGHHEARIRLELAILVSTPNINYARSFSCIHLAVAHRRGRRQRCRVVIISIYPTSDGVPARIIVVCFVGG